MYKDINVGSKVQIIRYGSAFEGEIGYVKETEIFRVRVLLETFSRPMWFYREDVALTK